MSDLRDLAKMAHVSCDVFGIPNGLSKDMPIPELIQQIHRNNPEAYRRLCVSSVVHGAENINTLLIYWFFRWVGCGMPVFRVTDDMLAGLALTDPGDVLIKDFHPPFQSILIQLPQNFWNIEPFVTKPSAYPETRNTKGFIRHVIVSHNCETLTKSMIINAKTDLSNLPRQKQTFFQAESSSGICVHSRVLKLGRTIGEMEDYHEDVALDDENVHANDLRTLIHIRRAYYNLCLYVAAFGRGKRIGRSDGNFAKRRKQNRKPQVWIIGKDVKFGPELIEAAQGCLSNSARWKVGRRFTVRGHWRNQPCGPGKKEVKRIWIKPHWKGPQDSERISHLYSKR